jgi:hypothetical protein
VPTPRDISKASSTFFSKIQLCMGALQQQVSFDPATFTQQLPLTSTALAVQNYSISMPNKPQLPLHAVVHTAAMAMSLALARGCSSSWQPWHCWACAVGRWRTSWQG